MRGIAVVDRQSDSDTIAIWLVSRVSNVEVSNTNAVVIDSATDPAAFRKVRSLTRCRAVITTSGSVIDDLPIEGQPLLESDLEALLAEVASFQQRITEAVADYRIRSGSKSLADPLFPPAPRAEDFAPADGTASQRAFSLANYVGRVWRTWLHTDDERRKRTIQPRTNTSPWIMPLDMNDQTTSDFPPSFATLVIEQPVI